MDRRKVLIGGGAAVGAAASSLAAPAIAQGRLELKMVTTWPRDFPGLGTGAQDLANLIENLSGGRIKVRLFAAGEMVKAFDSFDAVARGDADMYHAADYYWQKRHKAYNFFTSVPMGMTALELDAWIRFGGGQALWDELSAGFGVKPFLAGNTGVQMGGWFRNPIRSLDDMKQLKMRIPGLGGEVIKRLGGQAITLPGGIGEWKDQCSRVGRALQRQSLWAASVFKKLYVSRLSGAWHGALPGSESETVGKLE